MIQTELEAAFRTNPRRYITMLRRLGSYEEEDRTPLVFKRMRRMSDHPVFSGRMSGRWASFPHWYLEITDTICMMIRNEDPKRKGKPRAWVAGIYWLEPRRKHWSYP